MGWSYSEREYFDTDIQATCSNDDCEFEFEGEASVRHDTAYWECPECHKDNESLVDCE